MAKAFINGINIHYQMRGAGRDIVLIHGITSSLALWYNTVLPELSREYRATAYDLRGHGLSGLTETGYSSFDMASDLVALMDELGIQKACLVGHSFGGAIGLHCALLHPDRVDGVVLLDTGLACLRYLRIIQDWVGWTTRPPGSAQRALTLDEFLELDSKQDVTDVIRKGLSLTRTRGFSKGRNALTPRMQRLLDHTRMGYEFRDVAGMTEERLAEIQTPVMALYGETSPYRKMAEHISKVLPNCADEVLLGAGHLYAVFRPGIMLDAIKSFVRDPADFVRSKRNVSVTGENRGGEAQPVVSGGI